MSGADWITIKAKYVWETSLILYKDDKYLLLSYNSAEEDCLGFKDGFGLAYGFHMLNVVSRLNTTTPQFHQPGAREKKKKGNWSPHLVFWEHDLKWHISLWLTFYERKFRHWDILRTGRLGNVVSSWTAMCPSKIREFYKRREMDMRTTRISYYKKKLEKWLK